MCRNNDVESNVDIMSKTMSKTNLDIKKLPNMGVFGKKWGLSWGYII
jgi:hypothetical protein